MSESKRPKNHQSINPLEGEKQHLKTADLQAALGVASPATANSWADEYNQIAERPVRRNARGVRVFETWQIEEISQAYQLLATRVVSTRTEALSRVLVAQSKSMANNRLTAGVSDYPSKAEDATGDSSDEIVRQIQSRGDRVGQTERDFELPIKSMPVVQISAHRKPLSIKARWGLLKMAVAREKIFQWLLHCFSFGHSPYWQGLTKAQREVWIRRVGKFNNVTLAFGMVAAIAFGIINVVLWGLGFWVKVAAIPYTPVIWTVIVCALVIPTVLFFAFPQG